MKSDHKYLIKEILKDNNLDSAIDEVHYSHISIAKLKKGTHIFMQQEEPDSLFILLKGKIRIYQVQSNGKMWVLNIIDQFRILGDLELITHRPTLNSIDLLSDSEFMVIPMKYCRDVLLKDIRFLKVITTNLAEALYQVETNSAITTLFSLEKRVFSYILSIENDGYFEIDLKNLPDLFGTSYRHFLRVISKLREEKIIERNNNGFILIDKGFLVDQISDIYSFN